MKVATFFPSSVISSSIGSCGEQAPLIPGTVLSPASGPDGANSAFTDTAADKEVVRVVITHNVSDDVLAGDVGVEDVIGVLSVDDVNVVAPFTDVVEVLSVDDVVGVVSIDDIVRVLSVDEVVGVISVNDVVGVVSDEIFV